MQTNFAGRGSGFQPACGALDRGRVARLCVTAASIALAPSGEARASAEVLVFGAVLLGVVRRFGEQPRHRVAVGLTQGLRKKKSDEPIAK